MLNQIAKTSILIWHQSNQKLKLHIYFNSWPCVPKLVVRSPIFRYRPCKVQLYSCSSAGDDKTESMRFECGTGNSWFFRLGHVPVNVEDQSSNSAVPNTPIIKLRTMYPISVARVTCSCYKLNAIECQNLCK